MIFWFWIMLCCFLSNRSMPHVRDPKSHVEVRNRFPFSLFFGFWFFWNPVPTSFSLPSIIFQPSLPFPPLLSRLATTKTLRLLPHPPSLPILPSFATSSLETGCRCLFQSSTISDLEFLLHPMTPRPLAPPLTTSALSTASMTLRSRLSPSTPSPKWDT